MPLVRYVPARAKRQEENPAPVVPMAWPWRCHSEATAKPPFRSVSSLPTMTTNNNHNNATHYETLGVPATATPEEIKRAFRKRSLEVHPDVHPTGNKEDFQNLSNAHAVLSNAAERRRYDLELKRERLVVPPRHPRPPKPPGHVVMETLTNPRFFVLGLAGLGGAALLGSVLGGVSSHRPSPYEEPLVEAWKNPTTGRYEQPAPWDPVYQKLRPKLEKVPRNRVGKRSLQR